LEEQNITIQLDKIGEPFVMMVGLFQIQEFFVGLWVWAPLL